MSAYDDLTPKQRAFVEAYLASGNATDACLQAGYSARRARQQGHDNVTNRYIQAALAERRAQLASAYDVTPERVIAELALIGFSDLSAYVTWGPGGVTLRDSTQLDAAVRRAVSEVSQTVTQGGGSLKFKLHSKVEALDKLARHLDLYGDHGPDDATPLQDEQRVIDKVTAYLEVLRAEEAAHRPVDVS